MSRQLALFMDNRAESPAKLFQERMDRTDELYPWRMLVGCVLSNRTPGERRDEAMEVLLGLWPTPEAMSSARADQISAVLKPIGLPGRSSTLRLLSSLFARSDTSGLRGHRPLSVVAGIPGIGAYAQLSYSIFVEGQLPETCPTDKALAAYWRWQMNKIADLEETPEMSSGERETMNTEITTATESTTPVKTKAPRKSRAKGADPAAVQRVEVPLMTPEEHAAWAPGRISFLKETVEAGHAMAGEVSELKAIEAGGPVPPLMSNAAALEKPKKAKKSKEAKAERAPKAEKPVKESKGVRYPKLEGGQIAIRAQKSGKNYLEVIMRDDRPAATRFKVEKTTLPSGQMQIVLTEVLA